MRWFLFRPAFGFPGWVSVPFWWESAPKDLFLLWCSDGNACPSDIGIIDFRLFAFSPQLVTIKTVSKDTKQIPSQAVTESGQLFLFQIIAGLANSERAIIWANIEPLLNTVQAWQVNPPILWKIIIFHLTKEVLNFTS